MTDKQREYIAAIAAEKNVTRAAEKLFVTQSSLSQTLAHVEKELVDLLLDGKVDMIITITSRLHPDLVYTPLFDEDFLVFLAGDNPLCKKAVNGQLDLRLLTETPFILTKSGYNLRANVDKILTDAGICPRILMESGSMDVCMQMAAYGLGAAILPDSLYYFHEFKNRVQVFPTGSRYRRQLSFVCRKNSYIPHIMREFIRIASENLNAMHSD